MKVKLPIRRGKAIDKVIFMIHYTYLVEESLEKLQNKSFTNI